MKQFSLSVNQVCAVTGLGRTKVYEAINSGSLQARKIGKRTIVLQDDLSSFLNSLDVYTPRSKQA